MKKFWIALLVSLVLVTNVFALEVKEVEKYVGQRVLISYTDMFGFGMYGCIGTLKKIFYEEVEIDGEKGVIPHAVIIVDNEIRYIPVDLIKDIEKEI